MTKLSQWGINFTANTASGGALVSLTEASAVAALHKAITWVEQNKPDLLVVGSRPFDSPLRIEVRRYGE